VTDLGPDAAPIDAAVAFGSVWVANHHSDDVVRVDPDTGLEQARITFTDGTGPAWFAISDGGVWVTRQNTLGIARIDPETNELDPNQAGSLPPCGPPTVALGAVWYFACDTGQMVRIDLATEEASVIPADDLSFPIAVDEALYAVGPDGVVRLADDEETWTLVGGCCGLPVAYAGGTLWLVDESEVVRVDPTTGEMTATIPLARAGAMGVGSEVVWLAPAEGVSGPLQQIRIADNAILDPLQTSQSPTVVRIDGSTLWVTDLSNSELWRVDLAE
jgi:streptogramin lyase